MTYQDPDPTREPARPPYSRRDDGSWGMFPMLVVLVAILGMGYYAFNRMNEPSPIRSSTTTENAPGANTPPSTTPTQPTTPKQP